MVPWGSCYHYSITSFSEPWNPCSWRVGDSRWWRSVTTISTAVNKEKRLSSVNHTTKTILHHHHHHHHHLHHHEIEESHFNTCSRLKRAQEQYWRSHNNNKHNYSDLFSIKHWADLSSRHATKALTALCL